MQILYPLINSVNNQAHSLSTNNTPYPQPRMINFNEFASSDEVPANIMVSVGGLVDIVDKRDSMILSDQSGEYSEYKNNFQEDELEDNIKEEENKSFNVSYTTDQETEQDEDDDGSEADDAVKKNTKKKNKTKKSRKCVLS